MSKASFLQSCYICFDDRKKNAMNDTHDIFLAVDKKTILIFNNRNTNKNSQPNAANPLKLIIVSLFLLLQLI